MFGSPDKLVFSFIQSWDCVHTQVQQQLIRQQDRRCSFVSSRQVNLMTTASAIRHQHRCPSRVAQVVQQPSDLAAVRSRDCLLWDNFIRALAVTVIGNRNRLIRTCYWCRQLELLYPPPTMSAGEDRGASAKDLGQIWSAAQRLARALMK